MKRVTLALLLSLIFHFASADPMLGHTWQAFQISARDGSVRSWEPGRVTVIAFCAYWCDTWKTQLPRLASARGALQGLPVDFLCVSVDGRWSEVADSNHGLPLLLDKGGAWSGEHGVDRVPTTVVLDEKGCCSFVSGAVLRSEDVIDAVHGAFKHSKSTGTVYLTFDDFPSSHGDLELLDILRTEQVPATFFCICSKLSDNHELVARAAQEGHSLQIHSWDHHADQPNLERCRQVLLSQFNLHAALYRPPGSEMIIGEKRHHRIVNPYDYSRPSEKELKRRILLDIAPEAVIQLHAGVLVTQDCLAELIREIKARGFTLGTLH